MSFSPLAHKAHAQFLQFIEPLTRFDASTIHLQAGITHPISVRARQVDSVSYEVVYREGAGRVPSGTQDVGSSEALTAYLQDWRRREGEELPGKMRAWLERHVQAAGRQLEPGECFSGPHAGAFSTLCVPCQGKGKLACARCDGKGQLACPKCAELVIGKSPIDGYHACDRCHGSGTLNPTAIAGNEQRCSACHGKGTVRCMTCDPSTPGKIRCGTCKGEKLVACLPCNSTGWMHRIGTLIAKTSASFTIRADTDLDEPRSMIESLKKLAHLDLLAPLQQSHAGTDGTTVFREFSGTLPVTTLRLRAVHTEFDLVAYGEGAEIKDFKNVIGTLLDADVDAVTEALRSSPYFPLRSPQPLDQAVEGFLASEVLRGIGALKKLEPPDVERFAQGELKNAVAPAFALKAAKIARRAVARSFRSDMWLPLLLVAVLPAAVFMAAALLGVPRNNRLPVAVGIGIAAAVLFELLARWRLRSRFKPVIRRSVIAVLNASRAAWWWRAGMALSAVLVFVAAFAMAVMSGVEMRR